MFAVRQHHAFSVHQECVYNLMFVSRHAMMDTTLTERINVVSAIRVVRPVRIALRLHAPVVRCPYFYPMEHVELGVMRDTLLPLIRIVPIVQPHALHAHHCRHVRPVNRGIIGRTRLVSPLVRLDFMGMVEYVKSVPISHTTRLNASRVVHQATSRRMKPNHVRSVEPIALHVPQRWIVWDAQVDSRCIVEYVYPHAPKGRLMLTRNVLCATPTSLMILCASQCAPVGSNLSVRSACVTNTLMEISV